MLSIVANINIYVIIVNGLYLFKIGFAKTRYKEYDIELMTINKLPSAYLVKEKFLISNIKRTPANATRIPITFEHVIFSKEKIYASKSVNTGIVVIIIFALIAVLKYTPFKKRN